MKWSFKEDYLVGKFYLSHTEIWKADIDELMLLLKEYGFGNRGKRTVELRIQNFEYLHTGRGLSHIAKQTRDVYEGLTYWAGNQNQYQSLTSYISSSYVAPSTDMGEFKRPDVLSPSFRSLLLSLIGKKTLKDVEIYENIRMRKSTYYDIRSAKIKPSKENVMKLCIGVHLTYDESLELMAAADYAFNSHELLDLIIVWHLQKKIYNVNFINIVFDENGLDIWQY